MVLKRCVAFLMIVLSSSFGFATSDFLTEISLEEKSRRTDAFLKTLPDSLMDEEKNTIKKNILEGSLDICRVNISTLDGPTLGELTWLTSFRLSHEALISSDPENTSTIIAGIPFFQSTSSQDLDNILRKIINNNYALESLPSEIGKLHLLQALVINGFSLRRLPPEIGNLTNLKLLTLSFNFLEELPAEIGKLTKLEIAIFDFNFLEELPTEIDQLSKLTFLRLRSNELKTLPPSFKNLTQLKDCTLYNNQLPWTTQEDSLGLLEIKSFLSKNDCSIVINDYIHGAILPLQDVYKFLDSQPLHINRSLLKTIGIPPIAATDITSEEFIELWNNIVERLNLSDPASSDTYLSYDDLFKDIDLREEQAPSADNQTLMTTRIIAPLNGFLKELWGIEPLEDEYYSWKMYEDQQPELKNALIYILKEMGNSSDIDLVTKFTQLAFGILKCPSHQRLAIDSLYMAIYGQQPKGEFHDTVLEQFALFKTEIFYQLYLSNIMNETTLSFKDQNTHMLSLCIDITKEELNVVSNFPNFEEKIAKPEENSDFHLRTGNVLWWFYQRFTPEKIIHCFLSLVSTAKNENEYTAELSKKKYGDVSKIKQKFFGDKPIRIKEIVEHLILNQKITFNEDDFKTDNALLYFNTDEIYNKDYSLNSKLELTYEGAEKILIEDIQLLIKHPTDETTH